jgi:cysteine desulfurase / selenocysteine lyase
MSGEIIYFNNAATSWPKPQQVIDQVNISLKKPYQEHGRATEQDLCDYPKMARKQLAHFFNSDNPNRFIFTSNATDSLNLLIHGYVAHNPEKIHVVTSELEHNSVLRPLNTLQKKGKIDLSVVSFNDGGYITLEAIKQSISKDTKLVVLNHGSNVLGTVQDIDSIGDYLQKENIFFIIDTAQTAGHVNIDLQKTPVDALVFTGHKAMYGFQGIGGFYIARPKLIESYKQGGTGVYSEYPFHPQEMPLKFEYGTHNYPGIVSLYAGLKFIEEIGIDTLSKKTHEMTYHIIEELERIDNIILYNKSPDLPVIPFNIQGMDQDDVGFLLQNQFNIMTRTGLHCAPLVHKKIDNGTGCIRVSLSYFNEIEECDYFIAAVSKIAESVLIRSTD